MKTPLAKFWIASGLLLLISACAPTPPTSAPVNSAANENASSAVATTVNVVPAPESPPASVAPAAPAARESIAPAAQGNVFKDLGESERSLEKKHESADELQRQEKSGSGDDMERLD